MRPEPLMLGFMNVTYTLISGCGFSRQVEPAVIFMVEKFDTKGVRINVLTGVLYKIRW